MLDFALNLVNAGDESNQEVQCPEYFTITKE
jgi:hypothetical protein